MLEHKIIINWKLVSCTFWKQYSVADGERMPPSPLGWYTLLMIIFPQLYKKNVENLSVITEILKQGKLFHIRTRFHLNGIM